MRLMNLLAVAFACAVASPAFAQPPAETPAIQTSGSLRASDHEVLSPRDSAAGIATTDNSADPAAPEPAQANDYGNTRSNRTNGVFVPGIDTSAGEGSADAGDGLGDTDAESAGTEAKPSLPRSGGGTRTVTAPPRPAPDR